MSLAVISKLLCNSAMEGSGVPVWIGDLFSGVHFDEKVKVLKTGTRIDTGSWFGKRRIWVCAGSGVLYLAAKGPKPYTKTIEYRSVGLSAYNHVTGDLVVKYDTDQEIRIKLSPETGYVLIDEINNKES